MQRHVPERTFVGADRRVRPDPNATTLQLERADTAARPYEVYNRSFSSSAAASRASWAGLPPVTASLRWRPTISTRVACLVMAGRPLPVAMRSLTWAIQGYLAGY